MRISISVFKHVALGLAMIAIMTLAQGVANAETVTYGTTGSFNGGSNVIVYGIGANTLTITFNGIPAGTSVDANPTTFGSLGEFQVSVTGTGETITPTTFVLTINQTAPGVGSGMLSSTLAGTISQNSSTGQVTFTVTSTTINGVTYTVTSNPLQLVPPSTNNGVTSIQAQITVPEPTSMLLLGTGLIGVAGAARRRFKARK